MVEFQRERITCASSLGDSFNKESTEGVLKNQTGKQTSATEVNIKCNLQETDAKDCHYQRCGTNTI
jgi:hypothetical protein